MLIACGLWPVPCGLFVRVFRLLDTPRTGAYSLLMAAPSSTPPEQPGSAATTAVANSTSNGSSKPAADPAARDYRTLSKIRTM